MITKMVRRLKLLLTLSLLLHKDTSNNNNGINEDHNNTNDSILILMIVVKILSYNCDDNDVMLETQNNIIFSTCFLF